VLWAKNKDRRKDLALALLFAIMGLYNIFTACAFSSERLPDAMPWLGLISACDEVVAVVTLWYLAEYTGLVSSRIFAIIACIFLLLAAAAIVLPGELSWLKMEPDIFVLRLPFLRPMSFKIFHIGPLSVAAMVLVIPFMTYYMYILRRFYGSGHHYDVRSIGIASLVVALAVFNDALISLGAYRFIYLTQYAWCGALISLSFLSSHEIHNFTDRLQRLAHFDTLTGLPNRALFNENLASAIARAHRFGYRVALLFIDLDRFKYVNDTKGHAAGDSVLVEVAKRVKSKLRASDTVSRLGGDEFTVILEGLAKSEDAALVSQELLEELARPFRINGVDFYSGASIGVAVYPYDDGTGEGLMRMADAAMYRAKEAGGNAYRFISGATEARNMARVELEGDLRKAIEKGQYRLLYQPLVAMDSGRIRGAEALLRWKPASRDMVMPGVFIGLAEETGLILPIGEWVLTTACSEAVGWARRGFDIPVSINVSAYQFRNDALPLMVEKALSESGLPADRLIVEVAESAIMQELASAKRIMNDIRSLGARISIDDFGTGYSSLGYLAQFPVGELKIDQSFVREVQSEGKTRSIVNAIIAMARSLGLETVAEGIETEEQRRYLHAQHCDTGQGYLFARPVESERLLEIATVGYAALWDQSERPSSS
jgi:diguanylate cyclase (GGDEF)-like protein